MPSCRHLFSFVTKACEAPSLPPRGFFILTNWFLLIGVHGSALIHMPPLITHPSKPHTPLLCIFNLVPGYCQSKRNAYLSLLLLFVHYSQTQ